MDTIDLDAILAGYINKTDLAKMVKKANGKDFYTSWKKVNPQTIEGTIAAMKEAIHQALVLASENATASRQRVYSNKSKNIYSLKAVVDKQSILDVDKLVK